jgi:Flp pilus assembly protein TadG
MAARAIRSGRTTAAASIREPCRECGLRLVTHELTIGDDVLRRCTTCAQAYDHLAPKVQELQPAGKLGHHRPPQQGLATTNRSRHGEQGYVMVMFALLLVPILLMAGLAIDVGAWYSRAQTIQKAADAAALAGVVWLPDVTDAKKYATTTATANGFTNGVDGITVTINQVGDRRLSVVITDTKVGSTFYAAFGGRKITLARTGLAEYVLPVPLGSPDNHFGNDPTDAGYTQPNLWGNVHGPYTNTGKGDAFAAGCSGSDNCNALNNPQYRGATGYLYSVTVPAGVKDMKVQVYDAALNPRSAETIDTGDTAYTGTGTTTTNWAFYSPDSTPLDVTDNPLAVRGAANGCDSGGIQWSLAQGATGYQNAWATLCQKNGAVIPGTYLLRVWTTGTGSAANRYALRATASSTVKPAVAGWGDMSMYNNISNGSSSAAVTANFYLAEVSPVNVGKTFRISMYDPGEVSSTSSTPGNGTIKVLLPNGSVASSCTAISDSPNSTFTSGSTLSPCQFQSAVNGSPKFDGYWVSLYINIPTTYSCTLGTVPGCWWKVQYVINGQANDTTTWSAQVIGDPVHLVQPGT